MELKELFDLHEKLETRINAYWTYWSVAVFAIGGWLFAREPSLSNSQAMAVSLAAMVFFGCNLAVLWPATKLVVGIRDEIRLRGEDATLLSANFRTALSDKGVMLRFQLTVILHLVVDAVVIFALLKIV